MSDRLTPILEAIRLKVASLGLALDNVTLPVLIRREAMRRQELDPKSMITIAKSKTPEATTRRRFGQRQTAFVVDVIVHGPEAGPDAAVTPHSVMRDAIVDAFGASPAPGAPVLPGAPDVFDVNAAPADWLSPSGEKSGYDVWAIQIEATVAHA